MGITTGDPRLDPDEEFFCPPCENSEYVLLPSLLVFAHRWARLAGPYAHNGERCASKPRRVSAQIATFLARPKIRTSISWSASLDAGRTTPRPMRTSCSRQSLCGSSSGMGAYLLSSSICPVPIAPQLPLLSVIVTLFHFSAMLHYLTVGMIS